MPIPFHNLDQQRKSLELPQPMDVRLLSPGIPPIPPDWQRPGDQSLAFALGESSHPVAFPFETQIYLPGRGEEEIVNRFTTEQLRVGVCFNSPDHLK